MCIDSLVSKPYDYDPSGRLSRLQGRHPSHPAHGCTARVGRQLHVHHRHFANASHAFARALILGGVTHRFPDLRFAFLEGGVGWACNLVSDLVGHWERRRREAMEAQTRPTNVDRQELARLFRQFGGRVYEEKTEEIFRCIALPEPFKTAEELTDRAYQQPAFDDFGRVPVKSADELRQHFAERFYFGCEADDPMTAWAFDPHGNPAAPDLRPTWAIRRRYRPCTRGPTTRREG